MMGKVADRVVLDIPVHEALRERLEAAVGEICAAAVLHIRAGEPEFRMLSAQCGLGAEIIGVAERLRACRPETFSRLRCWGVDPDPEGDLLPEAARRARSAGLKARFIREDLRRHREVAAVARQEGPFHLVSCIGAGQGRAREEVGELVRFYAQNLAPGGALLIDRWDAADKSRIAAGLDARMTCHSAREFREMLAEAGLRVEREHPSGEGGCTLIVARKPVA
jgi:hypothetical protein